MLVHLIDCMRQTLGEIQVPSRKGPMRWPPLKPLLMYWLPWPKGRIKGAPELFRTLPGNWNEDRESFASLVDRFASDSGLTWPDHPRFGPMTREAWGRFAYRHFDHHLTQFGA